MRKKIFLPRISVSPFIRVLIFFIFFVFHVGCNNLNNNPTSSQIQETLHEWVAINVKFKSGTTGEMRDMCIRGIQKILEDSANALKQGAYPNFSPIFLIKKGTFGDSLDCGLVMGTMLKDTTVDNPTCKCKNNCGICLAVGGYAKDTSGGCRNISSISFPGQDSTNNYK